MKTDCNQIKFLKKTLARSLVSINCNDYDDRF